MLTNISIFRPTPRSHYLNITPDNLERVFPAHIEPSYIPDDNIMSQYTQSQQQQQQYFQRQQQQTQSPQQQAITSRHNASPSTQPVQSRQQDKSVSNKEPAVQQSHVTADEQGKTHELYLFHSIFSMQ